MSIFQTPWWLVIYFVIGFIISVVGFRLIWAHEYKRDADDGKWDNVYIVVAGFITLLWPLGALGFAAWGILPLIKFIYTPTSVRKGGIKNIKGNR